MDGNNTGKTYYTITEVSRTLNVKPYVLRYWEKEFREVNPYKDNGGIRRYRKKDIEILLRIKQLLHEKKFTVKGAKRILRENQSGEEKNSDQNGEVMINLIKNELMEIKNRVNSFRVE